MIDFFIKILNMSLTASIVACVVIFIRVLLKKAPKVYSYALWAVVLFRLLCPFTIESVYSLMPARTDVISQNIINPQAKLLQPDMQYYVENFDSNNNLSTDQMLQEEIPTNNSSSINVLCKFATVLWFVGVVILLSSSAFSYVRLKKQLKTAVRLKKNIYETDHIVTPFVLGFLKPRIYLPVGMENVDYILEHEKTHIQKGTSALFIQIPYFLCP